MSRGTGSRGAGSGWRGARPRRARWRPAACLETDPGDDEGRDARRTLGIDTLLPLDRRRTLMRSPASDADLAALVSGNYVNRFSYGGRAYKVIPQLKRV
mgnify:CR=1 FL=1